jgi:hypothetical protein
MKKKEDPMEETPSGSKRTGGMYRDMERERGKTERENRPEYVHRVCIAFILIPTRADFGGKKTSIGGSRGRDKPGQKDRRGKEPDNRQYRIDTRNTPHTSPAPQHPSARRQTADRPLYATSA